MPYTIRHHDHVLGTTTLGFDRLVHGQLSGWLFAEPGAQYLLDAVSIKSAWVHTWLTRNDTLKNGRPLAQPDFLQSRKCEMISAAVAECCHLVLSLHREDGSEIPTREIVVQDRDYGDGEIDNQDFEELSEEELAEVEAAVEHDVALIEEWRRTESGGDVEVMDDEEWQRHMEARWLEAGESRYQVHLRLENPDDLPAALVPLEEDAA